MTRRFDVLVVGAGPAGLAAAQAAATHGMHVGVVDDNPLAGGQIWRGGPQRQADARARTLWAQLSAMDNVSFIQQGRVLYAPAPGTLLVQTPDAALTLHYGRLILATGARELLLPFPGWTLPGVTGAGGLQALVKGGYPVAGKRVVVAGSGPLLLAVAATLRQASAQVVAIAEQAPLRRLARFGAGLFATPSKLKQAMLLARQLRGVPYHANSYVVSAHGDAAEQSVRSVRSVRLRRGGKVESIACDFLACGFGLLPNVELAQALGCALERDAVRVDDLQATSVDGIYCAGEGSGIGGVDLALAEGRIAGLAAAGKTSLAQAAIEQRGRWRGFALSLARAFALRPQLRALADDDTIVCRCEDVTHGELRPHDGWRSAKLQTRCGMGPCQGRVCGAATAVLYGWRPDAVRVPIVPARAGSIAAG
ncbi:FAD/NAD(P)-binding oxidoreductase [Rugamonas sp.]|uniref:NAD(P)/FAD-dependent oxidoreductase n=1 Tax=Rugamonas sp. TaxID=1926287 RepID=UPI0025E92A99|nr:FAD/NAD(P)-binding oxidoreductase [Rugamonas sp.]